MNQSVDFNFQTDEQKLENVYPANDVQYIYINDLNTGNHQNNYINFSNMTLVGNSSEKFFDWSQAYLAIPYTVTLKCDQYSAFGYIAAAGQAATGDTVLLQATATAAPENAFAVGVKGYHHFIDTTYIKYNGINVNRGTSYVNFMMNENLKK
jgi:hypothetical protein